MERTVRVFNSFQEADEADDREYAAMTPEERLKIGIHLREIIYGDGAEQRLARVYRVVKLGES